MLYPHIQQHLILTFISEDIERELKEEMKKEIEKQKKEPYASLKIELLEKMQKDMTSHVKNDMTQYLKDEISSNKVQLVLPLLRRPLHARSTYASDLSKTKIIIYLT